MCRDTAQTADRDKRLCFQDRLVTRGCPAGAFRLKELYQALQGDGEDC